MSESAQFQVNSSLKGEDVDAINRDFYGRFNYPWLPMLLPTAPDPAFWPKLTCQEFGDFTHQAIRPDARIWVAGCGTNQAALTALRFPGATVLGTDVSTRSLEACQSIIDQTGISNLTLEQASLNEPRHFEAFDYVICTGVIHHNANPELPLQTLSKALRPDGVLELMVYNYYHRMHTTAYQKAIRLLGGSPDRPDITTELPLTHDMIAGFNGGSTMQAFLAEQQDLPEAAVADSLLQPVEYSYTVATLNQLAERCGLALHHPVFNQFDKLSGNSSWQTELPPTVAARFAALDDVSRWQVTNLLMMEKSPMLWFYLRPNQRPRQTEAEVNAAFLDTVFIKTNACAPNYILSAESTYSRSDFQPPLAQPPLPVNPSARAVFEAHDPSQPIGAAFARAGVDHTNITDLRRQLTTPAFPYLVAKS
ncbi:MAG: methyltransferase domain-containing protein [Rhodobacteraceae bacterium]|nr:methyltransferase domain-containing protein [Paracoccaceae bacterium]